MFTRFRTIVIGVAIVALAAGAGAWWWRTRNSASLSYTTAVVKRGDVARTPHNWCVSPISMMCGLPPARHEISRWRSARSPLCCATAITSARARRNDFKIRDHTEISETFAATSRVMTNLLLVVALISLIVGGVGIMNIMLVSVTERTREIGIRMAVGARARDILRQFLVEAVVLCLAGGVAGILLGRGVSVAITALLHWPTLPSLPAIIASVAVAVTVGIIFGYYPAWKASRLDPIEALRYE